MTETEKHFIPYPDYDDEDFNVKIALKKEFNENKILKYD